MNALIMARVLHLLGVILWIGGVATQLVREKIKSTSENEITRIAINYLALYAA